MLLPMFLMFAAVTALLVFLSVKWKKVRIPLRVLAVIALLPTLFFGLIAVGAGDIVNYPGDPAAAVEGMVDALAAGDYEAADEYVKGALQASPSENDLAGLVCGSLSADYGAARIDNFTAVVSVELTVLDTEAWLAALGEETVAELSDIVEDRPVEEVFNEARDGYLNGIADEAYFAALGNMLGRGGEYLHTIPVDVTLRLTPFGWKLQLDEVLRNALEGYALGDKTVILEDGAIAERLSARMTTAVGEIYRDLPLLHKTYQIPEDALAAPKPQGEFGSTFDIAEVQAVIAKAERLLDGQELAWNPDLNFWSEEPIQYYYDESILALTWKEIINGNMVTFGEVKVAHGSQLRRALTGNQYGYGVDEYPTKLASNVNAVLAINGDFYGFRDLGITVYQRQLYRHAPASVDTAYFTADGNMIFSKRGELTDRAAAEQFIADNDVLFAVAFGPIMVENGEPVKTTEYAIGEINDRYSRAAIAQKDDLHYLVMTVNFEGPCQKTCTLEQAVQYISDKNVRMAYTLDGGQTASVVFNGQMVNRPDWGVERTMSDIIYFASAVPEGGS